jgi:hypothetical protein
MAGKKAAGENTKKASGNAKKAEAAAQKAAVENQKKAVIEDEEWGKGAKSNAKKYAVPHFIHYAAPCATPLQILNLC